jgi:hypothetical protein
VLVVDGQPPTQTVAMKISIARMLGHCLPAILFDAYRRNIMRKLGVHSDAELSACLKT